MTEESINSKFMTEIIEYLSKEVSCSKESAKEFIFIHGAAVWESSKWDSIHLQNPVQSFPRALVVHYKSLALPKSIKHPNKDLIEEKEPSVRALLRHWSCKILRKLT